MHLANVLDSDVLAVEDTASGHATVVTLGGAYTVDARDDGCQCGDKRFNHVPTSKHELAAVVATSDLPMPFLVGEDLGDRAPDLQRHEPADFGDGDTTGVGLL